MSLKLSRTQVKKTVGISLFITTLKYQGILVCIKFFFWCKKVIGQKKKSQVIG
jgi:hypothetical protein